MVGFWRWLIAAGLAELHLAYFFVRDTLSDQGRFWFRIPRLGIGHFTLGVLLWSAAEAIRVAQLDYLYDGTRDSQPVRTLLTYTSVAILSFTLYSWGYRFVMWVLEEVDDLRSN